MHSRGKINCRGTTFIRQSRVGHQNVFQIRFGYQRSRAFSQKKILSDEVVMSHGSSSVVLQCIWKLQIHWSMKSFWVEFRGLRYTTAVASTTVWTHLYNFPRPAPPLKIVSPLTIRPTICQNGQLVSLFFLGTKIYDFFSYDRFPPKKTLQISLYVLKNELKFIEIRAFPALAEVFFLLGA